MLMTGQVPRRLGSGGVCVWVFALLLLFALLPLAGAQPILKWERTFAFRPHWGEGGGCLVKTRGGYVVAGYRCSGCGKPVCVMKVGYCGDQIWEQSHYQCVGEYLDPIHKISGIVEDVDGGFILAGSRRPHDYSPSDLYLLKIDENGSKMWERTYGGVYMDEASSIISCPGGFLVVGRSQVMGGNYDVYVLKIDGEGEVIWENTYGGPWYDSASCVVKVYDGFVIGGETASFAKGGGDVYIVKIDSDGNKIWERSYGGRYREAANAITPHLGGSVVLAGYTWSYGEGALDVFVVKVGQDGNHVWNRTFGGFKAEAARAITKTPDQGFLITGDTNSFGSGSYDLLFLRLDRDGNEVWSETYGGYWEDRASRMVAEHYDTYGTYVLLGTRSSQMYLMGFKVSYHMIPEHGLLLALAASILSTYLAKQRNPKNQDKKRPIRSAMSRPTGYAL